MSEADSKKRKHRQKQPSERQRRGAPGVLFTCEVGRERKCQHQGREILQDYWERSIDKKSDDKPNLSLDEELAQLKKQRGGDELPFRVADTGCKGTVFLLCKLEESYLIPKPAPAPADEESDSSESSHKRAKTDEAAPSSQQTAAADATQKSDSTRIEPCWDPMVTIKQVFEDLKQETSTKDVPAPKNFLASRFVTRMIPIQASCNASVEDLASTVKVLLDRLDKSGKATYSIVCKRRHNEYLKRDNIINAIVPQVQASARDWTVNLKEPDYTIHVEVCKNLCGVSIFSSEYLANLGNFNLQEARAKSSVANE